MVFNGVLSFVSLVVVIILIGGFNRSNIVLLKKFLVLQVGRFGNCGEVVVSLLMLMVFFIIVVIFFLVVLEEVVMLEEMEVNM